ncbi:hypothetical protein [Simiduia sp. 21SJ11W-1]|nr:hypothetical protein [Simiduia sp. 21SJ11W-1]
MHTPRSFINAKFIGGHILFSGARSYAPTGERLLAARAAGE